MADYIPNSDGEFDQWMGNFASVVAANLAAYGLVATDLDDFNAAKAIWDTAYPDQVTKQQAAQAATAAKTTASDALETAARSVVRTIQADDSVSDEAKQAAGLTVGDSIPTAAAAPTTSPVAEIDTAQRLRHTVAFRDESSPTSRAKPKGVRGAEIWMKVGGNPPANEKELRFVTLDTRTPHVIDFEPAEANQTVYYWLRWISTRGEQGPWSAMVQATVVG
jgi:hypothetical protein